MTGPPGTPPELNTLFDLPLGWGVFAFLAISAAALFIIAMPGVFEWYTRNLLQARNYGRWIEYFFSSSIMIVLISMITGVSDVAALLAIFGVNASMILFGLLMEKYETPGKPSWLSFWFGTFAGIIPWIIIVIYVWSPGLDGPSPPDVRVRDHRQPLHLLQRVRRQHVAAVQEDRALEELPGRREDLHHPQPDGQGPARVAGVLGGARGLRL